MNLETLWFELKCENTLDFKFEKEFEKYDQLLFYLSEIVEAYGLEKTQELLYLIKPDSILNIDWGLEDVNRAIRREEHLKERNKYRKGRKYRTRAVILFNEWKERYDTFKQCDYDPKNLKETHLTDRKWSDWLELDNIKVREKIDYEFRNPDYIVDKAKNELSRTTFWRFKKKIEEYKEKKS